MKTLPRITPSNKLIAATKKYVRMTPHNQKGNKGEGKNSSKNNFDIKFLF